MKALLGLFIAINTPPLTKNATFCIMSLKIHKKSQKSILIFCILRVTRKYRNQNERKL